MTLVKKLSLLACLAPFSMALASNPEICINANQLYKAATDHAVFSIDRAAKIGKVHLHRWYSVGLGNYHSTMSKLTNLNNQWTNGTIGREDSKGVLCDYYNQNHQYVDLQLFYKQPGKPVKR